MNSFEKIVFAFYNWRMHEPPMYGWYHIMWITVLVATCALVCIFRKRISPRAIDITLIVWGCVLITLEAIKLVLYSFHFDGQTVVWEFDWGRFPFQFCSSPMYVAIPAGAIKRGRRVKEILLSFIGTFSLFAGLISMFFPSGMFADFVFIDIHTMVFHGSMVVVAVLLYVTKTLKTDFSTYREGLSVFMIFVSVAMILNLYLGHHAWFNMFYISPYEISPLEVFDIIQTKVPFIAFLTIYIIAFSVASAIVFTVVKCIDLIIKRLGRNRIHQLIPAWLSYSRNKRKEIIL